MHLKLLQLFTSQHIGKKDSIRKYVSKAWLNISMKIEWHCSLMVLTICTCSKDDATCSMVSSPFELRKLRYRTIRVAQVWREYDTLAVPNTTLMSCDLLWYITIARAGCGLLPPSRAIDIICQFNNEMLT